MKVLPWLVG